jgi:hypothetical protein
MTALWQRYENRQEVATLKALLQFWDKELASRDLIIFEERSAKALLEKEVFEANERYTRSVSGLSAELDRADQLASLLRAAQNECSEACKNAENDEAEGQG